MLRLQACVASNQSRYFCKARHAALHAFVASAGCHRKAQAPHVDSPNLPWMYSPLARPQMCVLLHCRHRHYYGALDCFAVAIYFAPILKRETCQRLGRMRLDIRHRRGKRKDHHLPSSWHLTPTALHFIHFSRRSCLETSEPLSDRARGVCLRAPTSHLQRPILSFDQAASPHSQALSRHVLHYRQLTVPSLLTPMCLVGIGSVTLTSLKPLRESNTHRRYLAVVRTVSFAPRIAPSTASQSLSFPSSRSCLRCSNSVYRHTLATLAMPHEIPTTKW